jgi:ribulose-5-phosphate 4-epimerase/fuculose-1-phosphate aldolase
MACRARLRIPFWKALLICAVTPFGAALAQQPAAPPSGAEKPLDPAVLSDLAVAYRTLARLTVLDAFGHVSVRDPRDPNHYLISRSIAPESVTPNDIVVLDLDSNPVDPKDKDKLLYRERFIHGEIYRARPDVNAIVHSHSPTVVPFSVTKVKLRPILHNAGFLGAGPRVFEIRKYEGDATNLEVENPQIGVALAKELNKDSVILMRGHGDTVVADTLQYVVFRAYYTEVNARQLAQALAIGGSVNYLTPGEARVSDVSMKRASARPWALWKAQMTQKEMTAK